MPEKSTKKAARPAMLVLEQYASPIGGTFKQRETLKGLGFRRIGQRIERADVPAIRGAVRHLAHLVRIVEGN